MVFSSIPFLFYFLPLLFGVYFLVPQKFRQVRNVVLLAFSLVFYAWGEGVYVLILLGMTVLNHVLGSIIFRTKNKALLAFGIAANLIPLLWFKYAGFAAELAGATGWKTPTLLLGISFFTFQSISFLVDLDRHKTEAPRSWINTALYITAFPQLIAGPIVRYHTIAAQIDERTETVDHFAKGIRYFVIGLSQKVLLANYLGQTADLIFTQPAGDLALHVAWVGIICFTLQIYFDFAGYSNMAIGLGHMFGFDFPQNFNFPYISKNVQEFWRRWHMTLSRWFRDYLYIPLGGNRHGTMRTIANLWIVFVLCGLWHGAALTFLFWGIWQGIFLTLERLLPGRIMEKLPAMIGIPYTLIAVSMGWVIFRADSLDHALSYYLALFGGNEGAAFNDLSFFMGRGLWGVVAVAAICTTPIPQMVLGKLTALNKPVAELAGYGGLLVLFALCVASLAAGSYNPFIYFRF